jgi:hypothetical protein
MSSRILDWISAGCIGIAGCTFAAALYLDSQFRGDKYNNEWWIAACIALALGAVTHILSGQKKDAELRWATEKKRRKFMYCFGVSPEDPSTKNKEVVAELLSQLKADYEAAKINGPLVDARPDARYAAKLFLDERKRLHSEALDLAFDFKFVS